MKKFAFVLTLLFTILTLMGSIYVLMHHGTVDAGHSVVPMVFAVASGAWYHKIKEK